MTGTKKIEIKTDRAPKIPGPLSQGIRAGNLLFVPCGPQDMSGRIVEGDFVTVTRQMMENTKKVLESAGSSMDQIVRADVFLKDMDNISKFNEVYKEYIKEPFPARSVCQPARTPGDSPCAMIVTALVD